MTTVLQIIPSLETGGAEQATVAVVAGLKAKGHRAIVVSSGGALVEKVLAMGGEHIRRPVASKNPAVMLYNAAWLARFIRRQQVEIVHARSRAPAWSAYLACRKTACSFVTTFHAAYKFENPAKKYYNSVMARGARVIAISEFIADHIRGTYVIGDVIRVIPRGIDLERFSAEKVSDERVTALRRAWNIGEEDRILLCPARLSPIKGQAVLLEALARLPKDLRGITTVIAGDHQGRDEYLQKLKQLVLTRNLQHRLRITGPCPDMPAAYKLAELVVAPSLVPEGFGRVPIEAMSMGVPVIASESGGFLETIKPGKTGWLVALDNAGTAPKKLADAITEALTMPPERRAQMVEAEKREARAHYDWRHMVASTLKVYDELTG